MLTARPSPAQVREGALLLELDGVVVEERTPIDPFEALFAQSAPIGEYQARDLVRAIDKAAAALVARPSAQTGEALEAALGMWEARRAALDPDLRLAPELERFIADRFRLALRYRAQGGDDLAAWFQSRSGAAQTNAVRALLADKDCAEAPGADARRRVVA